MKGIVWLFSPAFDLAAFLLPAGLSLIACLVLWITGGLLGELSPMGWLLAVVMVDVAHVYATVYRVYADPAELRRRLRLYLAVPVLCYAVSVWAYGASPLLFWRVLAYVAVVHFVRQQVGFVALCRRRDGTVPERLRLLDRVLDDAAVYAGTLYPLLYWHAHLPRRYNWFLAGDFVSGTPAWVLPGARLLWAGIGVLWLARQTHRLFVRTGANATKLLIMATTWATWYTGIVALDSDVAFTLTNVLIHGVPYMLLVWRYQVRRAATATPASLPVGLSLLVFYLPLLGLALIEEGAWDRLVWHEHGMIFPLPALVLPEGLLGLLVPLLALPQATHYVLDGFIWRRKDNPDLALHLGIG